MDLRLYLVTDDAFFGSRPMETVIRQAVAGGVTMVQLRRKHATARALVQEAKDWRTILKPLGIPLLLNDRLDVALAAETDGVHLGQSDLPWAAARRLAPPPFMIGASVRTPDEARQAEAEGVDYVAVSPVFDTPTKPDAEPGVGLEGIRQVRQVVRLPLVAIGGIQVGCVRDVIQAGANGVAVVSAILEAADPEAAACRLRREVDDALGGRKHKNTTAN
jgi:thiamine-phosphate pyrophosphorylase